MKMIKTIFHHCLVFLLFLIFARGQDDEKDVPKVQLMSTGETPSAFVQNKIDSHDVMVFARSYGPHNRQAKDLLKKLSKVLKVQVEFLDVDLLPGWDGSLIMSELQERTGQWSFPNIFIGNEHFGGNQELDQKHALGELEDMLKNAGGDL
mmetsp:Transcript_10120/g.24361  ORF Transcript_10120/g.24361 Transcript_10120/m.24361 type:complete len:150 (-) Transcript_10120:340-789(-)|eukprot:CAMPEP_0113487992 /NCGR_PEP_ID=MMETSP0014_2-20120614/25787_1 /TAXON_ID=2857 /ORGANISM="Nitzschia sp." /LENGTH=149 /DNA_ID=CAMNT_0000381691 /DNA_START=337 /DNA_END=786 /DNA_ORIENTATION=+ /assembly_acc=CAM_ASM_000159